VSASAGSPGNTTLRRSLNTPKIVVLVIAAAAPLAAMVGTVPLAFAIGNGPGVPGMFAVAGIVLLCFSVGYAAMSRRIVNAGGFYTYLSCGLGKPPAVGGGLIAVLSYNATCVGLIGAFGYFLHLGLAQSGISVPWEAWSALVLVATALLGYRQIDISARVLRFLMAAEIIVLLVLSAFVIVHRGTAALPVTSFTPKTVFSGTAGVTIMFAFSAFIGFESAALYGEEAHNPRRSVPLATYASVIVIAIFYSFTSWVAVGAVGPGRLRGVARHQLGNLFFKISNEFATPALTTVMQLLLVTSLFAAILALHNASNRYMFVLGRERVLPGWLGHVHARHASPHRASIVQTTINIVVISAFALAGLNPYVNLATSMIGLGTLGIVALQAATSISVIGFFRRRADRNWWRTFVAPGLGSIGLITGVVLLVDNFRVLTGTSNVVVSALPWLLVLAAAGGTGYALWLRSARPDRYAGLAATAVRDPGPEVITPARPSAAAAGPARQEGAPG
jgi:amino acid transporter